MPGRIEVGILNRVAIQPEKIEVKPIVENGLPPRLIENKMACEGRPVLTLVAMDPTSKFDKGITLLVARKRCKWEEATKGASDTFHIIESKSV